MKLELKHGVAFTAVAIGVGVLWFATRNGKGLSIINKPNVVTTDAGDITPTVQTSNVLDDGTNWSGVPFYLKDNYPATRDLGSSVAPTVIGAMLPASFNPQEIPPQV